MVFSKKIWFLEVYHADDLVFPEALAGTCKNYGEICSLVMMYSFIEQLSIG